MGSTRLLGATAALLLSAAGSSCASDVKSMRLAEVDLSNMSVVQSLGQKLAGEERAAFSSYVWRHRVTSAGFCGSPLTDHRGDDPDTIGEAIALTLLRDRAEAERLAQKPAWAFRWEELTRERDRLMDRQGLLLAQHGPSAQRLPAWQALQVQLARNGEAMTQVRATNQPAGAATSAAVAQ